MANCTVDAYSQTDYLLSRNLQQPQPTNRQSKQLTDWKTDTCWRTDLLLSQKTQQGQHLSKWAI